MRIDEAFVLGAMTGAVVVWLWGKKIQDGIGEKTREILVQHVNRLSAALDRLNDGEYGVCGDCAEPISPARLHVMPEVQTCVRCQDGIERVGRQMDRSRRSVFAASEYGAMAAPSQAFIRASYLPSEDDRDVRVPGTLRAAVSF